MSLTEKLMCRCGEVMGRRTKGLWKIGATKEDIRCPDCWDVEFAVWRRKWSRLSSTGQR